MVVKTYAVDNTNFPLESQLKNVSLVILYKLDTTAV